MGTWSIEPSSSLVSIDQDGLITYSLHTTDTQYTISYNDTDCGTITKDITIKGCNPTHFTKHVKFSFVMAAEYVNSFQINFSIRKKSDDTIIFSIPTIGALPQECKPESQYDEEVDIDAECPDGIENYYIFINVYQCLGYNPSDCSHNDGRTHNFFHNGAAMEGSQLRIDDLNDLRSEESLMSQLKPLNP